jgi:hypothetical protein
MTSTLPLLSGVPEDLVRIALDAAGGNELQSGKLHSPESSAALAVNTFGWFIGRAADLPAFPPIRDVDWPAQSVEIEREMRFPWSGGRHPWLDAAVKTNEHLIGIESKRFEPFRNKKTIRLSKAYDRDVWGEQMGPFISMRDALRDGLATFEHLDAAQLVKHAFGLVTESGRTGRSPVLLYLFAEPSTRGGRTIRPEMLTRHRAEINTFGEAVEGAAVRFAACSYREWLAEWHGEARHHAEALLARFQP